jgi:hypothetical protein
METFLSGWKHQGRDDVATIEYFFRSLLHFVMVRSDHDERLVISLHQSSVAKRRGRKTHRKEEISQLHLDDVPAVIYYNSSFPQKKSVLLSYIKRVKQIEL